MIHQGKHNFLLSNVPIDKMNRGSTCQFIVQRRRAFHMRIHALVFGITISSLPLASAHSRWSCPEPRSPYTDIKQGPCGDETNNFDDSFLATTGDGSILEIYPGLMHVTFEESISHTGAPFRISLSGDGTDENACILLDHIPHNDCCGPDYNDPSTYTPYAITIVIPNVICERCSLHLSNPMTDKIGEDGSPLGIGCTDPGTCFSVYHSCTKSFRIVGDANDGAVKRSEYACPALNNAETSWPPVWIGDNGEAVDASIAGVYRRESSIWSEDNSTLTTAPWQFRVGVGGACAAGPTAAPENGYSGISSTLSPSIAQLESLTPPPSALLPTAPKIVIDQTPPASPAAQFGMSWCSMIFCVFIIGVIL